MWPGLRGSWSMAKHGLSGDGKIRIRWTCCNACHAEHVSLLAARLHYGWLRLSRRCDR